MLFIFSLFSVFIIPAQDSGSDTHPDSRNGLAPLTEGWEYLWGDLPDLSDAALEETVWKPIDFPSNPPGRENRNLLWFRIRLPDFSLRDPYFFVTSIDINAEFYLEGRRFYSFGSIDQDGRGGFEGWPLQMIRLPVNSAGKMLYLRVFSNYRDIGLWGRIFLGEGKELFGRLYWKDFIGIVVLITSLIIGLIFFSIYLFSGRQQAQSLYLTMVSLLLSIRVFGELYLQGLLASHALLIEYSDAVTSAFLPFWITLIFRSFLEKKYQTFTSVLWKAYLGLFLPVPLIPLFFGVPLSSMYSVIDLITLSGVILLGIISLMEIGKADRERQYFYINFLIMAILVMYSLFMTRSILPWISHFDYLMVFQFSVGLALILGRKFFLLFRTHETQSIELAKLNKELEEQVRLRTSELEHANKKLGLANRRLKRERNILKVTSITDGLTGLYNRAYIDEQFLRIMKESIRYHNPLSVAMFDLDHFKEVNDEYGHDTGDEVLRVVSDIFRRNLRDTDIAGRYGGDEFLILFPQTDLPATLVVVERIRTHVAQISVADIPGGITISGGIAEYVSGQSTEELLKQADINLYEAKRKGRNSICCKVNRNVTQS